MLRVAVKKVPSKSISAEELKQAKYMLIKHSQCEILPELKRAVDLGKGRYRKLAPVVDENNVWRLGSRMRNNVPFTLDSELPVIFRNL